MMDRGSVVNTTFFLRILKISHMAACKGFESVERIRSNKGCEMHMGLNVDESSLSVSDIRKDGLDISWWVILDPPCCLLVVVFVVESIVVVSKLVNSLFSPSLSHHPLSFCSS